MQTAHEKSAFGNTTIAFYFVKEHKKGYAHLKIPNLFCYTATTMNLGNLLAYVTQHQTLLLSGALVILLIYVVYLHYKLSLFFRGESARSFESTIKEYLNHVDDLKKHDELLAEHALKMDKRLSQSIRNVSTMRFKAFEQNSSNQSFAIALLNEKGDGVILSSLHHRDHVSVFAKPVTNYTSTHDLTEEELAVLEESKKAHKS